MSESKHQVAAYDDAATLAARVARFVADSLVERIPVVTVSRATHRDAVDEALARLGIDPHAAHRDGSFVTLDAEEALSSFMVDGHPDPDRFTALLASVLPADERPTSAFGEMVAMLWERGDVVAALELESLWNTAIAARPIRLLCSYPGELLAGADLGDVALMCDLHDHVSLLGHHPAAGKVPASGDTALSTVHLPVPAAVASVRHFIRDALRTWGLDDLVGDVTLVTSELATNAITHGGSPFRASLLRTDRGVRVAVEDGSSAWPERHHAGSDDQDGRGLAIVEVLSQRCGCDTTLGGKVAWAELSA